MRRLRLELQPDGAQTASPMLRRLLAKALVQLGHEEEERSAGDQDGLPLSHQLDPSHPEEKS